MNMLMWIINISGAMLAFINAVSWGYAIGNVGDFELSLSFIIKLVFNKWFILAMTSAFTASILSYVVLKEMGVLAGRFFLSLGIVATILACTLVLGERLTFREWIGISLIIAGVMLMGR